MAGNCWIGLHGGGGGLGECNMGGGGNWVRGSNWKTVETTDVGGSYRVDRVTKTGAPSVPGWQYTIGSASFNATIAYLNYILDQEVGSDGKCILHGFSYGGGMVETIIASGNTLNGRLVGGIADEAAAYVGPVSRAPGVNFALYAGRYPDGRWVVDTLQGVQMPETEARFGVTCKHNGQAGHYPMAPNCNLGTTTPQGPPEVVNGLWWSTVVEPPPVGAWPTYQGESGTYLNVQPSGLTTQTTGTGWLGTGFAGRWFQSPEAIRWSVDPPAAGAYNIRIRYRQADPAGSVRKLRVNGTDRGNISFPQNASTWEANNWSEITIENVSMIATAQNVDLEFVSGAGPDIDQITFENYGGGTPTAAFEDKTNRPGFEGTAYVGGWDAVDETIRRQGVNVPAAGPYILRFRYARKPTGSGGGSVRSLYIDGVKHSNVSFPATAASDTDNAWSTVDVNVASLTAGNHTVELRIESGQTGLIDLDWMRLVRPASTNPGDPDPPDPPPPDPPASEIVVQAETGARSNVATDGMHVANATSTPVGWPGWIGDGYIGRWYQANEGLTISVTVPTAGPYRLRFRYRNADTQGASTRQFRVNNVAMSNLSFPVNASSWANDSWSHLIRADVNLQAGINTITLICPATGVGGGGLDLDEVGFTYTGVFLGIPLQPAQAQALPLVLGVQTTAQPDILLFTPFSGTTGDPWPAPWTVRQSSSGSAATIVGNTGQLAAPAIAEYGGLHAMGFTPSTQNYTIEADVIVTQIAAQQFQRVIWRSQAPNHFEWYAVEVQPQLGYIEVYRELADFSRNIKHTQTALTFAVTDVVHVKVTVEGSNHKCKWWRNNDPEPATWNVEFTDTALPSGDNLLWNQNGQVGTAVNGRFDNYRLRAPSSGGGTSYGTLIFEDNFSSWVQPTWKKSYSWGMQSTCTGYPNIAGWNTPEQVQFANGNLEITATRQDVVGLNCDTGQMTQTYPWRGGVLATHGGSFGNQSAGFWFRYGVVEWRARWSTPAASAQGIWPALWLYGDNGTDEIDMCEIIGEQGTSTTFRAYVNAHFTGGGQMGAVPVDGLALGQWHTYRLHWESNRLRWWIDDVLRHTHNAAPQTPMYLLANVAVGGPWPLPPNAQSQSGAKWEIDYVRVWQ